MKQSDDLLDNHPGALHLSPMDASLDEKLARMASKVYKDVVVPYGMQNEDDPMPYERRRLNIDGTWREHRYKNGSHSPRGPGFHFLEYAAKNFRNPLEMIQANSPVAGGVGTVNTTVGKTQ